MVPFWALQLLQAVVAIVLDSVIKDLPQIRSGLLQVSTPTATDAPVEQGLTDQLNDELDAAINLHQVPSPE